MHKQATKKQATPTEEVQAHRFVSVKLFQNWQQMRIITIGKKTWSFLNPFAALGEVTKRRNSDPLTLQPNHCSNEQEKI